MLADFCCSPLLGGNIFSPLSPTDVFMIKKQFTSHPGANHEDFILVSCVSSYMASLLRCEIAFKGMTCCRSSSQKTSEMEEEQEYSRLEDRGTQHH